MGAEFLAMILVVVYVGAVAVLFLFVVMMLDINFVRAPRGLSPISADWRVDWDYPLGRTRFGPGWELDRSPRNISAGPSRRYRHLKR